MPSKPKDSAKTTLQQTCRSCAERVGSIASSGEQSRPRSRAARRASSLASVRLSTFMTLIEVEAEERDGPTVGTVPVEQADLDNGGGRIGECGGLDDVEEAQLKPTRRIDGAVLEADLDAIVGGGDVDGGDLRAMNAGPTAGDVHKHRGLKPAERLITCSVVARQGDLRAAEVIAAEVHGAELHPREGVGLVGEAELHAVAARAPGVGIERGEQSHLHALEVLLKRGEKEPAHLHAGGRAFLGKERADRDAI